MQKHTPGPWTATEVGPAPRYMIAGAATSVAMTYGQSGQEADARLIAAAPDLLAALREAVELIESTGLDATPQRRAIAKINA